MSSNLMKTIFKGYNILIIVFGIINGISAVSDWSKADSYDKNMVGLAAIFTILIVLLFVYMAYLGLRENYDACKKIAIAVVLISAVLMVLNGFSGGSVLITLLAAGYLFLCISLDSRY